MSKNLRISMGEITLMDIVEDDETVDWQAQCFECGTVTDTFYPIIHKKTMHRMEPLDPFIVHELRCLCESCADEQFEIREVHNEQRQRNA